MKYLLTTTEIYRVDSEAEAKALIEDAKTTSDLVKYSCVHKERKSKGELVDEWFHVSLSKRFTDEKEPETVFTVSYEEG